VRASDRLEFSALHNTYPLVDQDTALELSTESDPRTCHSALRENLKPRVGNLRVVELCRLLVTGNSMLQNNILAWIPRSVVYLRLLSLLHICLHWRDISIFHFFRYANSLMQRFFDCWMDYPTFGLFRWVCLADRGYWNYWLKFPFRVVMNY
jgi:hypothetical protein